MQVAKLTSGRYESINAPSRIATLLPEIGAQVAKAAQGQSKQFRITAERAGRRTPTSPAKISMRRTERPGGDQRDDRRASSGTPLASFGAALIGTLAILAWRVASRGVPSLCGA